MSLFPPAELKRGDVLLWRRPGVVPALLRRLDGGRFDGASICVDDGGALIAAAMPEGVVVRPLSAWAEGCEEIVARRFRGDDGRFFDDQGNSVKPVLDKARYYTERGAHFAHDDGLQLALVASLRRCPFDGWLPGLSGVLAELLRPAEVFLLALSAKARVPMTSAGLAFRCYTETGLKYRVRMPRARSAAVASVAQSARAAYVKALEGAPLSPAERDLVDVHTLIQSFLGAYYGALGADPQGALTEQQDFAVPEIVTPADLEGSPNLVPLGRVA